METVRVDVARFNDVVKKAGYRNSAALSIEMGYSDG